MYSIETEIEKIKQMIPYFKISAQYRELPEDILLHALLGNQGRASYFGIEPSIQDYERAYGIFTYLFRAYDDLSAAYYLGRMYQEGQHVITDYRKAFEYYLEAAAPSDLQKEWQMTFPDQEYSDLKVRIATLLLSGNAKITDCSADNMYATAIACLLSAASDKNRAAVDLLMNEREKLEPPVGIYMRPTDLFLMGIIHQGSNEKIDSLIETELIKIFAAGADYIPSLLTDCIKISEMAAQNGNRDALVSYASFLLFEDIKRYDRYPDVVDYYHFSDKMKEIIYCFMTPRNLAEQFGNETLVVHSGKNVKAAMESIIKYYATIKDLDDISKIKAILVMFVNTCNNFVRKR